MSKTEFTWEVVSRNQLSKVKLVTGLMGSGKTTYTKELIEEKYGSNKQILLISLDEYLENYLQYNKIDKQGIGYLYELVPTILKELIEMNESSKWDIVFIEGVQLLMLEPEYLLAKGINVIKCDAETSMKRVIERGKDSAQHLAAMGFLMHMVFGPKYNKLIEEMEKGN